MLSESYSTLLDVERMHVLVRLLLVNYTGYKETMGLLIVDIVKQVQLQVGEDPHNIMNNAFNYIQ